LIGLFQKVIIIKQKQRLADTNLADTNVDALFMSVLWSNCACYTHRNFAQRCSAAGNRHSAVASSSTSCPEGDRQGDRRQGFKHAE
jgi:hypothetical protein